MGTSGAHLLGPHVGHLRLRSHGAARRATLPRESTAWMFSFRTAVCGGANGLVASSGITIEPRSPLPKCPGGVIGHYARLPCHESIEPFKPNLLPRQHAADVVALGFDDDGLAQRHAAAVQRDGVLARRARGACAVARTTSPLSRSPPPRPPPRRLQLRLRARRFRGPTARDAVPPYPVRSGSGRPYRTHPRRQPSPRRRLAPAGSTEIVAPYGGFCPRKNASPLISSTAGPVGVADVVGRGRLHVEEKRALSHRRLELLDHRHVADPQRQPEGADDELAIARMNRRASGPRCSGMVLFQRTQCAPPSIETNRPDSVPT